MRILITGASGLIGTALQRSFADKGYEMLLASRREPKDDRHIRWNMDTGFADEDLPRVLDPQGATLVTANQRIVARDFPHYLGLDYTRPDRALRVWARLGELDAPATADDMATVHRDRRSLGADLWVERLGMVVPRDDVAAAAVEALAAWDRTMEADSAGAALFMAARGALTRLLAQAIRSIHEETSVSKLFV